MGLHNACKKASVFLLSAVLCLEVAGVSALAREYDDFDYITSHVNLAVPSSLAISRPEKSRISTPAASYYITGSSDPGQVLTMNGKEVSSRGSRGSFGALVTLEQGENRFLFEQGGVEREVVITRDAAAVATTKVITQMAPSFDCATFSGQTINLSCVAPSGATVVATVGGRKVPLKQNAATARPGVPAVFSGKTTAGEVKGTRNLGPVTYTLNGQKTYQSAGSVFLTGSGSSLVVQVKNNAASIYSDSAKSAFLETARLNAVDKVVEVGAGMYRLASGGWIPQDSVQPLTGNVQVRNQVYETAYAIDENHRGELFTLSGTSNPIYRARQGEDKLTITLFHTTGVGDVSSWADDSELFSEVRASEKNGNTTIEFIYSGKRPLWGYDIRYQDGQTYIYAKYKPVLKSGSKPLANMVIVVDAGHGGSDPGAIGIPGTAGPVEKDIVLASAIAIQKRLETLGATVVMTRTADIDLSMNDRMTATQNIYADLFLSVHGNSIGYGANTDRAAGTEVYYYEDIAGPFASRLSSTVAAQTGRTNRKAKLSNYRVTLNSFAPSVLLEMGFLSNPVEYDNMTTRRGIFNTANAVGESIITAFQ